MVIPLNRKKMFLLLFLLGLFLAVEGEEALRKHRTKNSI
jgi:hypothetical protein